METIPTQFSEKKDIFYAAMNNDHALMKNLIEQEGISVNSEQDVDGDLVTALHWAALKNHLEMVKYLVENKADPNVATKKEGHTPLHWACFGGNLRIIHYFITHCHVEISQADNRGQNALHHATIYKHPIIAHYLIQKGLGIDVKDGSGATSLAWAAYNDHIEMARYLVQQGADVKTATKNGKTPLHWAALRGNSKVARFLCENGADATVTDLKGEKPSDNAFRKQFHQLGENLLFEEKRRGSRSKISEETSKKLWFTYPFIMFYSIMFFFATLHFLFALIVAGILAYGSFNYLKKIFPKEGEPNTFFVGMIMASYTYSAFIYFSEMIQITNVYFIETILFITLNLIWIPLYAYMLRSDPGTVKKSGDEWNEVLNSLEKGKDIPNFCFTCEVRRPLRGKHCSSCKICVAKFDHHCGWLNNCVGVNNMPPFLICLSLVFLGHIMFSRFLILFLGSFPGNPPFLPLNHSLPFYCANFPMELMLLIFHLLNIMWQSFLVWGLIWHLLRKNKTTNEYMFPGKYEYLRHPITNEECNPFDKGVKNNIADIFSPMVDYYHLYSIPDSWWPRRRRVI